MMISQDDIDAFREMKKCYIFDVDGTLTPSRGLIDKEFLEWFLDFVSKSIFYRLVKEGGGGRRKTMRSSFQAVFGT